MHRSGTSATARFISLLGADLPKNLVPAKADNALGYWEPREIVRVHDALLAGLGTSSADPLPFPRGWLDSRHAETARRDLTDIIAREFQDSSAFVVKDPRISRILPLWLRLLDDLAIEARVIIPFRNPLDVAASLHSRDRMSLATSLLLYVDSYLNTELASRGRRRCFVDYDALLGDWRQVRDQFAGVFGDRLLAGGPESAVEIDRFLAPSLRHHTHSRDALAAAAEVPRTVVDLFDLLSQAGAGGDAPPLWASFDALRETVCRAAMLYRPLVLDERTTASRRQQEFECSRSWRMTAPLRWIHRRVRGGPA